MPRKGVQVNTDTRRVYLFIAVGLMAAGVIGYGVWRAGTPTTPSASDTATVTPEVSTIPESAHAALATPISETPTVSVEAAPQPISPPRLDDPFLAPHAIVQAVPSTIAPTTVYRPENIRPTPTTEAPVEPTELMTTPEQPLEAPETTAPESTEPTEPTEAPDAPGTTPSTPTTPSAPGTEPTPAPEPAEPQVTDTTEPTDTPATTEPAAPSPVETPPTPGDREIEQAGLPEGQPAVPLSGSSS